MEQKQKLIVSTAIFASLGIGVLFMIRKYNKHFLQKFRRTIFDYKNPLRYQHIEILSNFEDCKKIVSRLRIDCQEYRVLGFDCEWTTVNGSKRPVALLQLATQNGLCALIRLCNLKKIPPELRDRLQLWTQGFINTQIGTKGLVAICYKFSEIIQLLLEDENIIKVGVVPSDDAKYLARDYGLHVASTLDLRYLAQSLGYEPVGLAKLADIHLNVQMNKHWRVRCSDWEAIKLTDVQMVYAATDAHVAVELFKVFNGHSNLRLKYANKVELESDIANCHKYLNLKFNQFNLFNIAESSSKTLLSKKQNPIKVKNSRSFSTRTNVLYTNCFLQAPDGELLATIDRRKAEWYVAKSLGTVVAESPYTVRLNFEPAARAVGNVGEYYKLPKLNRCVVCGVSESFNRKNIVPREYRKHFPDVMKSHSSHDIVLLCPNCNRLSISQDMNIRLELARLCDAPFLLKEGCLPRVAHSVKLKKLKSHAKALYLHDNSIPDDRKQILQQELLKHYPPGTKVTDELLLNAMEMDTSELNSEYIAHGAKVVEYFKNSDGGLIALENIWREHFLKTMQPKYLPELWSMNHTVERLKIRQVEGRIEETDLKYAGLGQINIE